MKYLKSIFESNEMDDIKKYIHECFLEFIDEGAQAEFDDDQDIYTINIKVKSYRESNRKEAGWDGNNIERFTNTINTLKDITTLIDECLEKVKIKYPYIDYSISLDDNNNSIHNLFIKANFYIGEEDI